MLPCRVFLTSLSVTEQPTCLQPTEKASGNHCGTNLDESIHKLRHLLELGHLRNQGCRVIRNKIRCHKRTTFYATSLSSNGFVHADNLEFGSNVWERVP